MRHWLFKSEPDMWSWDQQVAQGPKGEEWNGVRNYQARNHMRDMRLGDLGFFYHSQKDKAIVGVVEVCAEIHPDSTSDDARWECVDIRAVTPASVPVTLAQVKAHPVLGQMVLAQNTRLSVQPVAPHEWDLICDLAGIILPPR